MFGLMGSPDKTGHRHHGMMEDIFPGIFFCLLIKNLEFQNKTWKSNSCEINMEILTVYTKSGDKIGNFIIYIIKIWNL